MFPCSAARSCVDALFHVFRTPDWWTTIWTHRFAGLTSEEFVKQVTKVLSKILSSGKLQINVGNDVPAMVESLQQITGHNVNQKTGKLATKGLKLNDSIKETLQYSDVRLFCPNSKAYNPVRVKNGQEPKK